VRPHAVTSVSHSVGAADSYAYDAVGNTVTRPVGESLWYDVVGRIAGLTALGKF